MIDALTSEQKLLAEVMRGISERCYCAGWMEHLEYILWDALINGQKKYGQDVITRNDIEQLKRLSEKCNCWIYFDDVSEETAIDLELWRQKFKEY